ncbi:MAG: hypothetical protein COY39_02890 [Alphaproteobacteria bacterium CG_4_10_14_0_8_um_filter_37_21]|nr:MAG: hypothetical protein COY39_02890 [Alphaproteobacteria bacterium CG_4_10_14_0_8_um_filter_37_21]
MSLKNIIPVFLCAVLNLSATTQETQTDPLPGIYQLPAVQPICFSETTISKALQAAQIREQALRSEILAEEEKGRLHAFWYLRMDILTTQERLLGIEGDYAAVYVPAEEMLKEIGCSEATSLFTRFPEVCRCELRLGKSDILSGETRLLIYLSSMYNLDFPFLGRAEKRPNEMRLKIYSKYNTYGPDKYFLEPIEGQYHVDKEGRMMPMFNLVAEKKTEEEMKQH